MALKAKKEIGGVLTLFKGYMGEAFLIRKTTIIKVCDLVNIVFEGFNRYIPGVTLDEFSFKGMIYFCTITPSRDVKYLSIE